jgi:hypothetical protein
LCLVIDPVEILENQAEGLDETFAKDEALDRVVDVSPPLPRIESTPGVTFYGNSEECKEGWQERCECLVEGEDLAGHPLPDLAGLVPILHSEIVLEKIDDR